MPRKKIPESQARRAEKIEVLPVSALVPYANNPRTHSQFQVDQLAGSIREFGFTNPVLIDEQGTIIAGHGRVLAAQKLGMLEVPCIRLGYLTAKQRRAYVIADNKLALNAGWDFELLKLELTDLSEFDLGFSLDEVLQITGFSASEPLELESGDSHKTANGVCVCPKCGFEF
ncbi:MAG: ParB/Srx family N-terminal domain-containing protein [Chloroflexota bacterium]